MRHAVWLRADLRLHDNTALHHACADALAEVCCVYLIADEQWRHHDVAGIRVHFELDNLESLKAELLKRNIPLITLKASLFADAPHVLATWAEQHRIDALFFNKQYELNETTRDQRVMQALASLGVSCHAYDDQCIQPPQSILNGSGNTYAVFTPFKRQWLTKTLSQGLSLYPAPKKRKNPITISADMLELEHVRAHYPAHASHTHWPIGEKAALKRLQQFADQQLLTYQTDRNRPDLDATSQLGPYLSAGIISARTCLQIALNKTAEYPEAEGDIHTWIAELAWRDFYRHILAANPDLCRHYPYKKDTQWIQWSHDEREFQKWCDGETGFPIVDAAMRQLKETGWMHNRLRMITAMFLCKDLFIDWRMGERYFMQHLIDGDFASNNGGWQWCASTGNDSVPYFRVFNPTLQSQKVDPQGEFIKRYLPALSHLAPKQIHAPYAFDTVVDYPPPMVDHSKAKTYAITQFKELPTIVETMKYHQVDND